MSEALAVIDDGAGSPPPADEPSFTRLSIRMVRQCCVCDCSESRQSGWMCEHIVAAMALLEKISIDALLSVLPVRRRPGGQFKCRGALARTRFNKSDARFFGVSHLEQLFMESPAAPTHWHVTKEFSVKNRGQVLREHVPGHVDRWLENGGRYQWKVKFSTGNPFVCVLGDHPFCTRE
ncbi:uncharacterized protein PITG_01688 [Phytophthora infestans T30-4]|uniref:SWIM-type domain-containing protein n=1 Tax=Phytophthora infestans (strain T30-4) TaxID=403677 RepID=D0MTU5_PHYIT|nr:uncharacterized protein PITG_01688 [Phytophthora infestans T30-4]EEY61392.1 hypothetical protein PITG_01688 [Phytophthora infestans T30-4]|eukprot:XP_002908309.1 hypothetical protein PITG_01688 [Phytophthora infestans T30-4]